MPVLLIQAQEHTPITRVFRIAWIRIVRPDEDAPARHHRRRMRLRSKIDDPLHILLRLRVETVRQMLLLGHQIARPRLPPLRLIGGEEGQRK